MNFRVDDFSHVLDQSRRRLACDFVDFHLANVENTDVIQPFASVEASKNEQLVCTDHTGCMPLPSDWRFFDIDWMGPSHSLCVQDI